MQTITILLLVLAIYGKTAHSLSQELRDHVLKIHNGYRMNVTGACQMQRMVYDEELERQATGWANRCVFKHEMVKGRGENLAWNTAKSPETELMNNAAKSWYDEVRMYSYGQSSCSSSCHYTQMVWAKTNRVGCATKRCSYLTNAYADAWYFVCFYTPMGNMYGEKPYPKEPCSPACIDGQTKDSDGLCVGTATGGGSNTGGGTESSSGGGGSKQKEPCVDKRTSCPNWSKDGECRKNPGYMLENCKKSCKVCVSEEGTEENTGGTNGGKDKEEPCVDKDSRCPKWAEGEQCRKNPGYMLKNCMKSCKVCGSEGGDESTDGKSEEEKKEEEPCEDKRTRCVDWQKSGQCEKNPGYMLKNCRKSCRVCTGKGEEGENKGGNEDKKETGGEQEEGSQGDQGREDEDNGCGNEKKETKDNKNSSGKGSKKEEEKDNKGDNKDKEEAKESCPADKKKCRYWKKRQLCTKNKKFMERRCKRACGFCTP